jgi:hypothetical protein
MSLLLSLTAPADRIEAAIVFSTYLPMMDRASEVRTSGFSNCRLTQHSHFRIYSGWVQTLNIHPSFGCTGKMTSTSRASRLIGAHHSPDHRSPL